MRYAKTPLNIQEQAHRLLERGLICEDVDRLQHYLGHIGYYRLSAYWLPFEAPSVDPQKRNHTFLPNTTFDAVLKYYVFDRKLRLLVMDAIERIEVAVRTRWASAMALRYGSHAHMHASLFKDHRAHTKDLEKVAAELEKSSETFVVHYRNKYDDPTLPPIWATVETMTLGTLARWFKNTKDNEVKKEVMQALNMPTIGILESMLDALTPVRNICAHHGRLWNRRLVMKIPIIKRLSGNMIPQDAPNHQAHYLYNYLVVMADLKRTINPRGLWLKSLSTLLADDIDHQAMGFPPDWKERSPWCEVQP
jgi:abortive infection bacteriophage resistance protein